MNVFQPRIRHLGVVVAAAMLSSAVYAQSISITPEVQASKQLTIASSLGYAPFEFVDANGNPAGLDIDLANAVAKQVGAKLNIVTIPFAAQIPSLASNRVKIGWATFSITKERLSQVDFVAFLQAGTVASTTPDKAKTFHGKDDLCAKPIAVQTGTSADFAADKLSNECKAKGLSALRKQIYPGQQETIQAVLSGRAVAMLDDSTSSGYYEKTSNRKLVVLPGSYYPTPLGLAVAKGDKATASMVSAALQKLIADGTYGSILAKYNLSASALTRAEVFDNPSQVTQ